MFGYKQLILMNFKSFDNSLFTLINYFDFCFIWNILHEKMKWKINSIQIIFS